MRGYHGHAAARAEAFWEGWFHIGDLGYADVDERQGQEVTAFIVPRGRYAPAAEEIVGFRRERLAAYKYSRPVEFRATRPLTAAGKVVKRDLA